VRFYRADVKANDRTTATFTLKRADGSITKSTVGLPSLMALTAPAPMATVSYASGKLTLTWTNKIAGAKVHVFTEPCDGTANTQGPEVDDTGTYDLATKDMVVTAPTGPGCVELRILRTIKGQVDPAFKGDSSIESERNLEIKINLTP
jgi:hypothetical protein